LICGAKDSAQTLIGPIPASIGGLRASPPRLICPSLRFSEIVSTPSIKNISLLQNPASALYPPHPAPTPRGVSRSSRHVARGAMDALGRPDERGAGGRRNRVVLAPRRWCQVLRAIREATEANKPGTPGRARISRNTIAQGRLDRFGCPVVACVRKVHFLCTQGSRVRPASGLPCAL